MSSVADNKKWDDDKEFGDLCELIVLNYLKEKYGVDGYDFELNDKKLLDELKKWDISVTNKKTRRQILFENKGDRYKSKTMFIEFKRGNGEPSGINVTESDYWCNLFHTTKELWIIKTDDLKNIIDEYSSWLVDKRIRTSINHKTKVIESYGYSIPLDLDSAYIDKFKIIKLNY